MVVGLCGNDTTITRGSGHEYSHAVVEVLEEVAVVSPVPPIGISRTSAPANSGPQMWIGYDGRRHEGGVAGREQHPHQVAEALLGADRGDDLGLGIELDAEAPQVQVGDGLAQLRDAPARRVPVVAGVVRRLGELLDRDLGRRDVGVAEAEVDHVCPARRASIFSPSMIVKTYGGRSVIRRNSMGRGYPGHNGAHGSFRAPRSTLVTTARSTSSSRSPAAAATSTSTTTRRASSGSTAACSPRPCIPPTTGSSPTRSAEDGDPLDALVLLEDPTFPGCWVRSRPVGVFWMTDDAGPDAKIICVPADDPRWDSTSRTSPTSPNRSARRSSTSSTSTSCSSPARSRRLASSRAEKPRGTRSEAPRRRSSGQRSQLSACGGDQCGAHRSGAARRAPPARCEAAAGGRARTARPS